MSQGTRASSRGASPAKARRGAGSDRPVRATAAERREVLVQVARRHFAERGYYGTPTLAIADEAGISQAYLFRLYPTKQDLFSACVESCIADTRTAFELGGSAPLPDERPIEAMGRAYLDLLSERPDVLLCQLHANAAAAREPKIRVAMRDGWRSLFETVERVTGAPAEEIRAFFAQGMLLNVAAAVGFDEIDERWAETLGTGRKELG